MADEKVVNIVKGTKSGAKRRTTRRKPSEIATDYKKKIVSKEICKGVVRSVLRDKETDEEMLVLDLEGFQGIVKKDEVDAELHIESLLNFVGREISYVVKGINEKEKKIYLSRKDAQLRTKDSVIGRLKDGEAVEAQIINILPHGAYVEIDGVTGLLKNTDFAEDFTTISEKHSQGDKINVKLKKTSSNGLMLFEATKKYCDSAAINPENIEKGQVILGRIRSIKPFGIFVNVAPYLDVLCPSEIEEYEEDKRVQVRIEDIQDKPFNGMIVKRYKGKILKVL